MEVVDPLDRAGLLRRAERQLVRAAFRNRLGLRLSQARARRRGWQGRPRRLPPQPDRHRPLQGRVLLAERPGHLRHQRELPRAEQAVLRRVNLKGGGDAASAARAVLQTGDYDFAWNLQVEPEILAELEQGGKGSSVRARHQRSSASRSSSPTRTPRSMASGPSWDRQPDHGRQGGPPGAQPRRAARCHLRAALRRRGVEPPTANILTGIPAMDSPNTSWEFNLEEAKRILEEAGWT